MPSFRSTAKKADQPEMGLNWLRSHEYGMEQDTGLHNEGIDPREFRSALGCFPTGVTIITTRDRHGNFYGLTANAVTSVSLAPPLLLVCIDRKAETFAHFYDSLAFVVNLLTEEQEPLSSRFAKSGGDKFTGVPYRLGRLGIPVLDEALGHLECRIVAREFPAALAYVAVGGAPGEAS